VALQNRPPVKLPCGCSLPIVTASQGEITRLQRQENLLRCREVKKYYSAWVI